MDGGTISRRLAMGTDRLEPREDRANRDPRTILSCLTTRDRKHPPFAP